MQGCSSKQLVLRTAYAFAYVMQASSCIYIRLQPSEVLFTYHIEAYAGQLLCFRTF